MLGTPVEMERWPMNHCRSREGRPRWLDCKRCLQMLDMCSTPTSASTGAHTRCAVIQCILSSQRKCDSIQNNCIELAFALFAALLCAEKGMESRRSKKKAPTVISKFEYLNAARKYCRWLWCEGEDYQLPECNQTNAQL